MKGVRGFEAVGSIPAADRSPQSGGSGRKRRHGEIGVDAPAAIGAEAPAVVAAAVVVPWMEVKKQGKPVGAGKKFTVNAYPVTVVAGGEPGAEGYVVKARVEEGVGRYVAFYGHRPTSDGRHVMSQFYPVSFVDENGVRYCTAEQYMMSHKAAFARDHAAVAAILATKDPKKQKALGRRVRNLDISTWHKTESWKVVVRGNWYKFSQNADLATRLLSTGDDPIVEATENDKRWGNGLSKAATAQTPYVEFPGENRLGVCLMHVRHLLRISLPVVTAAAAAVARP
jgi:ribA/ribD-fused uncharacterized protein